jgi:hypothetical protein
MGIATPENPIEKRSQEANGKFLVLSKMSLSSQPITKILEI